MDDWIQTITENIGINDSELQSNSNGENKNSLKNIGNFLFATAGILLLMAIVGICLFFKKSSPSINKVFTSLE